jgi:hypothetical protein
MLQRVQLKEDFLESLRRWKKAENNSNLLQCNIDLKGFRDDHRFNRKNK